MLAHIENLKKSYGYPLVFVLICFCFCVCVFVTVCYYFCTLVCKLHSLICTFYSVILHLNMYILHEHQSVNFTLYFQKCTHISIRKIHTWICRLYTLIFIVIVLSVKLSLESENADLSVKFTHLSVNWTLYWPNNTRMQSSTYKVYTYLCYSIFSVLS